jgi:hypothetical protein
MNYAVQYTVPSSQHHSWNSKNSNIQLQREREKDCKGFGNPKLHDLSLLTEIHDLDARCFQSGQTRYTN